MSMESYSSRFSFVFSIYLSCNGEWQEFILGKIYGENTKALFSLLGENSSLSNTNLFLSFHIAQNRQRGAALQTFLSSFLRGILFQPIIKSLMRKGTTQAMPMAADREVHKPNIMGQRISKCSIFSSSFPQREHLLAREHLQPTQKSFVDFLYPYF